VTDLLGRRQVRTWALGAILIVVNVFLFFAAWAAGLRLRPWIVDVPIWSSLGGEYGVLSAGASLTFLLAGGLTRLWSRHWMMVAVPALISFEVGLTMLAMAIYLGDGGSEALMWTYIWPNKAAWAAGGVAASFAVAGYLAISALARRRLVAA